MHPWTYTKQAMRKSLLQLQFKDRGWAVVLIPVLNVYRNWICLVTRTSVSCRNRGRLRDFPPSSSADGTEQHGALYTGSALKPRSSIGHFTLSPSHLLLAGWNLTPSVTAAVYSVRSLVEPQTDQFKDHNSRQHSAAQSLSAHRSKCHCKQMLSYW